MKLFLALALVLSLNVAAQTAPRHPFPQHVTYAPGTIKPTNFTQAQQDTDVRNAYAAWKGNFVLAVDATPLQQRIAFGKANPNRAKTVSEGQGYGMVITVLMAGHDAQAQVVFDGLWHFVRANPSSGDNRLMAWEIPTAQGDTPDSAFDGDADIAYALLLADKQWGSAGAINYKAEALKVIAGMKAATIGATSKLPLLGDWVKDSSYTEWQTRSSDFMYGHFRAYGRATGDATWSLVVKATQSAATSLQAAFSPTTGLLPDFIVAKSMKPFVPKPAPANFLEDANDGAFYYNACRDPWRMATDALLNNDAVSLTQVRKMSAWIARTTAGDPRKLRAGYKLTGTAVSGSNYFTTAFVAPFGVAAMTNASQQAWLNRVYASVRLARGDYYEDSINLLCLLTMTGNFWDPTLVP